MSGNGSHHKTSPDRFQNSSGPDKDGNETPDPRSNFVSRSSPPDDANNAPDASRCAGDESISAVKDGDEYLIIRQTETASGDDGVRMDRERAVRHAVIQGERLWKIPDNWTPYMRVLNEDDGDQILYGIPQPGVNVIVRCSGQDKSGEPQYRVEHVGQVDVEVDQTPDEAALQNLISEVELEDDRLDELLPELRKLEDEWQSFERDYVRQFRRRMREIVWSHFKDGDMRGFDAWSLNPWQGGSPPTFAHLLPGTYEKGSELRAYLLARLVDADVVAAMPDAKIEFDEGKGLPDGYYVQGLTEAGCSPSEIIDYLMVNQLGHSYQSWSDVRGTHPSQVRESITAVKEALRS